MSASVSCSNCGKTYHVDQRTAGRKVRCRNCKEIIEIPVLATDAPPAAPLISVPSRPAVRHDPFAGIEELNERPVAPSPVRSANVSAPRVSQIPGQRAPLPVRRSSNVGGDSATPWLIILLILAHLAAAVTTTVNYFSLNDAQREMMPVSLGAVWVTIFLSLIFFFAIVGPLTYLGIFISSKIMRFEVVDSPIFKASGIAAVPGVVLALMSLLPANPVLLVLLFIGIVPLAFYVLKFAFDLRIGESIVSFLFAGPFYVLGQVITFSLLAMVLAGFVSNARKDRLIASMKDAEASSPGLISPGGSVMIVPATPEIAAQSPSVVATPSPAATQTPSVDPGPNAVVRLRKEFHDFDRFMTTYSLADRTKHINDLKVLLAAFRQFHPGDPTLAELDTQMADFERRVVATPSADPPKDVFETFGPLPVWEPAAADKERLVDEYSFKEYRLRLPKDARSQLAGMKENDDYFKWSIPSPGGEGQLKVCTFSQRNPKQMRPWLITDTFLVNAARVQKLYAIDARHLEKVTSGLINGLPFTRIQQLDATDPSARRTTTYTAAEDDRWLIVEAITPSNDVQTLELMDSIVRTMHRAKGGEVAVDPRSPEKVAPLLLKGQSRSEASELLIKQGAVAEDAVLAMLGKDADLAVVTVLAEIGTKKSIAALTKLAAGSDRKVAQKANEALKRISPNDADSITASIEGVTSLYHPEVYRPALQALAQAAPTDGRRPDVEAALFKLLESKLVDEDIDPFASAFVRWADATTTAPKLAEMLKGTFEREKGLVLMKVLSILKYPDAAPIFISQCDILGSEHVFEALTEMGPVAEDAVLRMIDKDRPAPERQLGANVLREIGTKKSIPGLTKASNDAREARAAQAAKDALQAVKDRMAGKGNGSGKG